VPSLTTILTQISRDDQSVTFSSELPASNTEGWFYLPLAYDTAIDDGLYNVSFYVGQTHLGGGQVRIGEEIATNTDVVEVNGLVLDKATQKPLAQAWVALLQPGVTAEEWKNLGFPYGPVLAIGQSDSQGRFSLLDPVNMEITVHLGRHIAYSIYAWLDGYQDVLADDIIIGDTLSSPVLLTIQMQR